MCEAGRIEEAQEVLVALEARVPEIMSPLGRFWLALLTGGITEARGDLEAARAALDAAAAMPRSYQVPRLERLLRGRLEVAAGDDAAAITAWREQLDLPDVAWQPVDIPVLYELARLKEMAGEVDAAREHYAAFLAYWGEADLPLPSIDDAKTRLARL